MINPWFIVFTLLGWGASLAGAGWWSYGAGRDAEIAQRASDEEIRREAREQTQQVMAEAVAKIKVRHTTVREEFRNEVVNHVVYRDCQHTGDGLRLVQEALTGRPFTVAEGVVRPADGGAGPIIRVDQRQADLGVPAVPGVPDLAGDRR